VSVNDKLNATTKSDFNFIDVYILVTSF
jgi:hypothetical protein